MRWTASEDQILERMLYEGKSRREIAAELKRTELSVAGRIIRTDLTGLCKREATTVDRSIKIWSYGDEVPNAVIERALGIPKSAVSRYRKRKPKDWVHRESRRVM